MRRAWVMVAWTAALLLALLAAYSAALARLPQQRSAIESFLRTQTGFELRFERLAVQLGLYGPEAHFGDVTLWRVGSERQLLQAPELVVRFETWRLLRSGTLRPGRILVVGAEIDTDALRELEAAGRRTATPQALSVEQRLLRRLVDLASGLPPGRIEFEAATLRGLERDADGAATGRLVSLPRLLLERSPGAARVQGGALLGGRLGRSLNLALELRGLDVAPGTVEGALTLQGRGLRAEGWAAAIGLPRAGWRATADLRMVLRLRAGTVLGGSLSASGRDLQLPPQVASGAGARYAQFSGELGFDSQPDGGWSLRATDLRLGAGGLAAARVTARGRVDAAWRALRIDASHVPLEWLQPLLGVPALQGFAGDLDSVLLELRRDTGATGPRYAVRAASLAWVGGATGGRLAPLALRLEGDARRAQLELEPADTELTLPPVGAATDDEPERHPVSLSGVIDLRHEAQVWRGEIRSLQLAERLAGALRPRLDFSGAITLAAQGADQLELGVTLLEPVDARAFPALDRLAATATSAAVRDVALAGGRVALRAGTDADGAWRLLDSDGELAVARAELDAAAGWPALSQVGGRLRWNDPQLRFEFERGEVAGLRLLRGRLERGDTPRWSVTLDGPVEAAVDALAASPIAAQLPAELTATGLEGAARFELQVEAAAPAQRWTLQVRLQDARWRLLAAAPAIEALTGSVRIVDGVVAPVRLDARWLGHPVRLDAQRRRGGMRWSMAGRWPFEVVADLLPGQAGRGSPIDWRLDAAPLRGSADRWRIDLLSEAIAARATFEVAASGTRGFEMQRGAVRFGGGAATLPAAAELRVSGMLAELELSQLARHWPALAPLLDAGPPTVGELALQRLSLAGVPLGPVGVRFDAAPGGAQVALDGAGISGRMRPASLQAGERLPLLQLQRLTLPRLPGLAALRATTGTSPWGARVSVDALRLGEHLLGAARASLVSDAGQLVLRDLQLSAGDWLADGTLGCQRQALRCELDLAISGGAAAEALALWNVRGEFEAARIDGRIALAWPITAREQSLAALDGSVRLTATDGRLGAPVRLGLLPASEDGWSWRDLTLDARVRGPRLEIQQLALEGEQRLLLRGVLGLPDASVQLDGQWWPQRELPQALEDWPAATTLAALVRALRGRDIVPRPVAVVGPLADLEMRLPPLQSPTAR
ncbi:MAG: DUF3971 domain-containing protein [Steroidobacteraceae bacterium]